ARRKHPVFRFYDADGGYVCEVRYGGGTANALQRGFWTDTKRSVKYFGSVTGGGIRYSQSPGLVRLFSHALLATEDGQQRALDVLVGDVEEQKRRGRLKV